MNKLSKTKIIIIAVIGVFGLVLLGGSIYVHHYINSLDIRSLMLTNLAKIFPGAEVRIGQIELKAGLKVKLVGRGIDLTLKAEGKRPKSKLFSLNEVKADIPLWAVLMGTSSVDIVLDKPELAYLEFGKSNNWQLAMGQTSAPPPTAETVAAAPSTTETPASTGMALPPITVPAIVARASLNFRLVDLQVHYALKNGQTGDFTLNRFIVRNLNFKSPTAIELASKIAAKLPSGPVGMDILLIGDLNLQDLIKKEKFSTKLMLNISDINGQGLGLKVPNLKMVINAVVDRKGSALGDFTLGFNEQNKIATKYQVQAQQIALSDMNVYLKMADLFAMANLQELLKGDKAVLTLTGSTQVELGSQGLKAVTPDLKFALDPAIVLQAGPINAQTKLVGSVKGPQIELSVTNELLEGSVNFLAAAKIDLAKQPINLAKIAPVQAELRANNLKLPREFWQKLLYSGDSKKKNPPPTTTAAAKASPRPLTLSPLPKVDFSLSVNQVMIDGHPLEGKGKILLRPEGLSTQGLKCTYSGGTIDVKLQSKVKAGKKASLNNFLNFGLKNLELNGLTAFMPPQIKALHGSFSAQGKGNVDLALAKVGSPTFDVQVSAQGAALQVEGLEIGHMVKVVMSKVSSLSKFAKSLEEMNLDFFDQFILKAHAITTAYQLEEFTLRGHRDDFVLEGRGQVLPQGASEIGMRLTLNSKIGSEVRHAIGTNEIPLKLTGPGFALNPDYTYTATGLLSKAAEFHAKKQVQKAAEKYGEKLLKGLFKH